MTDAERIATLKEIVERITAKLGSFAVLGLGLYGREVFAPQRRMLEREDERKNDRR